MREPRGLGGPLRHRRREDAEVGDFDVALDGDDHVRRRQAEVRESAPVRVADGARGLRDQGERTTRSDRDTGELCFLQQAERIETGDVLDRRERLTLCDAELRHAGDARMLEAAVRASGCGQRLCDRTDGEIGSEALHRELTLEASHAKDFGSRHHAIGPTADRLQQLVASDAFGRRFRIHHPNQDST